ncbi:outer membrane protein assembly factor BamC [Massilia sp. TS11]|uniref:outer membrane protein assembly factor BamC n=1 Tax=Massilia sp. TS11 TaxID=2908003 RepID=UPI001ED9E343|nr:outer membrane protein assembly factor BamC [Massilia sp. TS11]MCG2582966.1 outer membrane protein assembly factor BamC [Massilia sp. TS11]
MTNVKHSHAKAAGRGLVLSTLVLSLGACNAIGNLVEGDKLDYRAAKKASPLDVPPDLTQLQNDGRYAIPDNTKGIATASGYQTQRGNVATPAAASGSIGPVNSEAMRIERAGDKRWLVVKQSPEALWPQLKQFWNDAGFTLIQENATTGTMETDWAENRAKIPQDFIRSTLGKVFDGLYSSGERDKFRTRLERNPDGSTEIYISHRGAQEVVVGSQHDQTQWTLRPNDPGLEAAFLARLMARLSGADKKTAEAAVAAAQPAPEAAKLVGSTVELAESFDRAWRRVGLALDRAGFTVEDRDRNEGVYFVRYVDPDAKEPGFFAKLFSSEKDKEAQKYRILVKANAAGSASVVSVQTKDGKAEEGVIGKKIISTLNEQLK